MTTTRLLFLSGSLRTGSLNTALAAYAHRAAVASGHSADIIDLRDYPLPVYDGDLEKNDGIPDTVRRLKGAMEAYRGVFIASPEYNASVSPLVKNTLDWLSRPKEDGGGPLQLFKQRVFAISSASPSMHGGARGLIALRQVLAVGLGALVLPEQFAVSQAHKAFDEAGEPKDEIVRKTVGGIIDRLAFTAGKLFA